MTPAHIPEIDNGRRDRILRCAGRSVLDVGCGDGRWVGTLLQYGFEIYGIDAAPRPYGPAVSHYIFKADACHLPFKDQSFDTVLMINVLEHLDDDGALREAYRICRKNVIFSVPHEQEEELGEYNLTCHPIPIQHIYDIMALNGYVQHLRAQDLKSAKSLLKAPLVRSDFF